MSVEDADDRATYFADWGETVTYQGSSITAIFDKGFIAATLGGEVSVASNAPQCLVLDSEVTAPAAGHVIVRGGVTYHVVPPIESDGTGFTLLNLEQQ